MQRDEYSGSWSLWHSDFTCLSEANYFFSLLLSGVHSSIRGSAAFNNDVFWDSRDSLMLYLSSFSFFQNPDIEKEK